MKLFVKYIKDKIKIIGAFGIFLGIFWASITLWNIPAVVFYYPGGICCFLGLVLLVWDYISIYREHKLMKGILNNILTITERLPKSNSIIEEDYQEIIRSLNEEIKKVNTDFNVRYTDRINYYTLWIHQIKLPIASMKLTLDNEDNNLSRKLKSDLKRIEQYAEMVMTYLRLEEETKDYVFGSYILDDLIKEQLRYFSSEFIDRKLKLIYEPINKEFVTDKKWFSFIITQIISNSLKYTNEGYIRIYLEKDNLYIEDTGIGIEKSDIPRIFEKGYTGFNGLGNKSASGIGLYLVKKIADELSIGITVYSIVEKGTTVCLDLSQNVNRKE